MPPPLPSPPFLRWMPFLAQPSQFILAWDRHQVCWLAYPVAWFVSRFQCYIYYLCVCMCACLHVDNNCTFLLFVLLCILLLSCWCIRQCLMCRDHCSLAAGEVCPVQLPCCCCCCCRCIEHVTHAVSSPLLQTVLVVSRSLSMAQCDDVFTQLADNARLFHTSHQQTWVQLCHVKPDVVVVLWCRNCSCSMSC